MVSADDGTAACLIAGAACPDPESGSLGDPLTGSASAAIPLPRCQDEMKSWEKRAVGVISGDGTIIVYACGHVNMPNFMGYSFHVALFHPGDTAWMFLQWNDASTYRDDMDRYCIMYGHGRIMLCAGSLCSGWANLTENRTKITENQNPKTRSENFGSLFGSYSSGTKFNQLARFGSRLTERTKMVSHSPH